MKTFWKLLENYKRYTQRKRGEPQRYYLLYGICQDMNISRAPHVAQRARWWIYIKIYAYRQKKDEKKEWKLCSVLTCLLKASTQLVARRKIIERIMNNLILRQDLYPSELEYHRRIVHPSVIRIFNTRLNVAWINGVRYVPSHQCLTLVAKTRTSDMY